MPNPLAITSPARMPEQQLALVADRVRTAFPALAATDLELTAVADDVRIDHTTVVVSIAGRARARVIGAGRPAGLHLAPDDQPTVHTPAQLTAWLAR